MVSRETRRVRFENPEGMELVGLLGYPGKVRAGETYPSAVLCHSFTGYKELPPLKALSDRLVEQGLFVLRFDFADCIGESQGSCREMKLTSQIGDLRSALDFLSSKDPIDPERVGVMGHSLGGLTAVLEAAEDHRPSALVPVAAPNRGGDDCLFSEEEIERWREEGSIEFQTYKRGEIEIGYGFYEDLRQYEATDYLPDLEAPIRFVHGTRDEIVPLKHSERMYDSANEPKDLHVVEGADHMFSREGDQEEMVEAAADWFLEWL